MEHETRGQPLLSRCNDLRQGSIQEGIRARTDRDATLKGRFVATPSTPQRVKRWPTAMFLALNLFLCLFFVDGTWNQNTGSRAIPVYTWVTRGTLELGEYQAFTIDKAKIDGRYYSEKAPLTTFVTLAAYRAALVVLPTLADRPFPKQIFSILRLGGVVCGSLAVFAIFVLLESCTAAPRRDLLPWVFYGSLVFAYGGTLFGHALAALFLVAAYSRYGSLPSSLVLSGFFMGAGIATEYPLAAISTVWGVRLLGRGEVRNALAFAGGHLPFAALLLCYNWALTGNAWTAPYKFNALPVFAQSMNSSYGLGFPSMSVLAGLLVGPSRGLLIFSPVCPALCFHAVASWRERRRFWDDSLLAEPIVLASIATLTLFSSYYMWWGGRCFGPRHLVPILALWIYEFLTTDSPVSAPWRNGIVATGAWGIFLIVSDKMTVIHEIPEDMPNPVAELLIPRLLSGPWNGDNALTLGFGLPPGVALTGFIVAFAIVVWLSRTVQGNSLPRLRPIT